MRILLLLSLVSVLCLRVNAQETSEIQLQTPSAATLIEWISEMARQQSPSQERTIHNLYGSLTWLVFWRFPNLNDVPFEKIIAAYDAMGIARDEYFGARGRWVEAILAAWIAQTQPDLSQRQTLRFDNFQINVTPRDFDADGQDEYVLDVTKGQPTDRLDCRYQAEYVNYLVVRGTPNAYTFVDTPLYWEGYGTDFSVSNFGEGGQAAINFEDINADGLPEWLVAVGGETFGGPSAGYENVGQLYLLGWRAGRLVDLARLDDEQEYPYSATYYEEDANGCDRAIPHDITWELVNRDADAAQEIDQHQVYRDNWNCLTRETKMLDWDAAQDRYVQTDTRRDFPIDSQNCADRHAEEAMWAGDYAEALRHYERASGLPPTIDLMETSITAGARDRRAVRDRRLVYERYHLARMALAYQLTGQPQQARAILATLSTEDIVYEPVKEFITALVAAPDTPFGACLAAYTAFALHFSGVWDQGNYKLGVTLERAYDNFGRYSPARIGCDASALVITTLNASDLATTRLPTDILASLGLAIRETVRADLNGDGTDEWLVWTESPMNPILFVANDGGHYEISTPAVDPYRRSDGLHLWRLPDEGGTAIGYFSSQHAVAFPEPWACAYDPTCGLDGGSVICSPDGFAYLSLWRLEALTLSSLLNNETVCHHSFAALFPDGEGSGRIDGGILLWYDDGSTILYSSETQITRSEPIQFVWDANSNSFSRVPFTLEPTRVPTATPPPLPASPYGWYGEAINADDYPEALTLIERSTSSDYYRDRPEELYPYQYTRAFILERLQRPDEALAAYRTLYETAPESPWGQLARLHLALPTITP